MWDPNGFPAPTNWSNQDIQNAQQHYQQHDLQYQAKFPITQGHLQGFPTISSQALQSAYNQGREDERKFQDAQRNLRYQQFLQQMQAHAQIHQNSTVHQTQPGTHQNHQQIPLGQQGIPGFPQIPTTQSNASVGRVDLTGDDNRDETPVTTTHLTVPKVGGGQTVDHSPVVPLQGHYVPKSIQKTFQGEDAKPGLMDFVPGTTLKMNEKATISELQVEELDHEINGQKNVKKMKEGPAEESSFVPSSSCFNVSVCSTIPSTATVDVSALSKKQKPRTPTETLASSEGNQVILKEPIDEEKTKKIAEIYNRLIAPLEMPPRKEPGERTTDEDQRQAPVRSRPFSSRPRFHVAVHLPRFERLSSVPRVEWAKYCLTCLAHGTIKLHHGINERCFFKGCRCSPYGCQWPKSRLQDAFNGWEQEQENAKMARDAEKIERQNLAERQGKVPSTSSTRNFPEPQMTAREDVVYKQNCCRCKVHGHLIPRKGHGNCPFAACNCSQCHEIEKRNEYFRKRSACQKEIV